MRTLSSVSSAAAFVAMSLLCAPPLASSAGAEVTRARGASVTSAPRAVRHSHNFAGYVYQAVNEPNFTVATQIVVPKLKCTNGRERAIDPSVGMLSRKGNSLAALFVGCENGKAEFFPNLEVNGSSRKYTKLRARPGDTIVLRAVESASATAVSAVDKTHKFKKALKGAGNKQLSGPWVGDVGWYNPGLLGTPNFGTLHFSNSKLDGTAFASWGATSGSGATPVREDRAKNGAIKITTSAFAKDGEAFTTTYKRS